MATQPQSSANSHAPIQRETFSSRGAFILAAIGSAVGLGNIWRFPYVAYTNGAGAFIFPYLVALLTAGIPLLFLFYSIGHRFRGSPPLAFKRLHPKAEIFGWWQALVCLVIATYYAAVIGWALSYTFFSIHQSWGDDPSGFFISQYLQVADSFAPGLDFIPAVFISMVAVWAASLVVLILGVEKGIARASKWFMPLLFIMFIVLVVRALFLPGAMQGIEALFTPDWSQLANGSIWIAAYGQIFFSVSIGFGIMITYSSYLKSKTNLTGSALVVGFANSSFELLAGIGVFAALGFISLQTGQPIDEVADDGVGLAFIGFPTIISNAPLSALTGILFFASLVFAGFTSMISIMEVVISSVVDKTAMGRTKTVCFVGGGAAVASLGLFSTATGLNLLDITDAFINSFGIVLVALAAVVFISCSVTALPTLRDHLNSVSSFKVGRFWQLLVAGVTPIILGYTLIQALEDRLQEGYGDMPFWFVNTFGWGTAIAVIVIAWLLARMPWGDPRLLDVQTLESSGIAGPILDKSLDVTGK